MLTRKTVESTIGTIAGIANPNGLLIADYAGKQFVIEQGNVIDNLTGKLLNINAYGITFSKQETAIDIAMSSDAYANSLQEYVKTLLISKLYTVKNEIQYKTEDFDTGIAWFDKKQKLELDLLIKNAILTTPYVISLKSFNSTVSNNGTYSVDFIAILLGGSSVWLAITN